MAITQPKKKRCSACRELYQPWSSLQKACSLGCAQVVAVKDLDRKQSDQEKEAREWIRKRKAELKPRSHHIRDAQTAFNAYVRARDEGLPCVSCGRYHDGQWHAGHYRTVGAHPELRFEETNCHRQCAPCNNHKSGDIVNYRINLLKRIGQEALNWLEGPHEAKKYSLDQIKAIKADYRARARELARQRKAA